MKDNKIFNMIVAGLAFYGAIELIRMYRKNQQDKAKAAAESPVQTQPGSTPFGTPKPETPPIPGLVRDPGNPTMWWLDKDGVRYANNGKPVTR